MINELEINVVENRFKIILYEEGERS